jgi:multiple sugar transport system substrate-binding protein
MARTQVDYWEKWGGEEWEAMAAVVQAFNTSQDTYEVVMAPAGDWSASPDLPKFLRALERGLPPDLIGLENHQIADLAAQKALTPLGDLLRSTEILEADFQDRFLKLSTYDGKLYGIPVVADIVTLYVNLAAIRGTLFQDGRIPADLSEFNAGLDELQTKGVIGLVPTYPGWWPHAWPWFFGGRWFDDQGRFAPDRPANIRAYEWVASLRKRWGLEGFSEPVNPIGIREPDPFLSGTVAMVLDGDWLAQRLLRVPDFVWTPAAVPTTMGSPAALICADILSVPSGSQHPEGAAEFIQFAARAENLERLALGQRKISPLEHWSSEFTAWHENPKLAFLREILSSALLFCDPQVPGWLGFLDRIKRAFRSIWTEGVPPTQALAIISEP